MSTKSAMALCALSVQTCMIAARTTVMPPLQKEYTEDAALANSDPVACAAGLKRARAIGYLTAVAAFAEIFTELTRDEHLSRYWRRWFRRELGNVELLFRRVGSCPALAAWHIHNQCPTGQFHCTKKCAECFQRTHLLSFESVDTYPVEKVHFMNAQADAFRWFAAHWKRLEKGSEKKEDTDVYNDLVKFSRGLSNTLWFKMGEIRDPNSNLPLAQLWRDALDFEGCENWDFELDDIVRHEDIKADMLWLRQGIPDLFGYLISFLGWLTLLVCIVLALEYYLVGPLIDISELYWLWSLVWNSTLSL